jgi:hypothetical protein
MLEKFVTINGIEYLRRIEMLGDVEKITYFKFKKIDEDDNLDEYLEIYDSNIANELEIIYEKMCTAEFTPELFFI